MAWKPCDVCRDKKAVPNLEGWYQTGNGKEIRECDCHRKWREEKILKARAVKNGVQFNPGFDPAKEYEGRTDTDQIRDLIGYAQQSILRTPETEEAIYSARLNASVYIHCVEITGNEDLTKWLSAQIFERGWTVGVTTMKNLMLDVTPKKAFEEESVEVASALFKKWLALDFLIITRAFLKQDAEGVVGTRLPNLDQFLYERLVQRNLPTIFLSTTPLDKIETTGYYATTSEYVRKAIRASGGTVKLLAGREIEIDNIFNRPVKAP